jgi:uncharacterized protein (DUF2141 family)
MKLSLNISISLLISIVYLCFGSAQAQNINLNITGIKNNKGQIAVSVFTNEQGFKDNQPIRRQLFSKAAVANGSMSVSLMLDPGTYGIALLDDEDGNGEMKKNMLGIPKEGFGFSNFYLSGMSRPKFNDFKFEVKAAPVKLESKIRYM